MAPFRHCRSALFRHVPPCERFPHSAPQGFFGSSVDHLEDLLLIRLLSKVVDVDDKVNGIVLEVCGLAALRRKKLDAESTHFALFFATLARRINYKRQFEALDRFPALLAKRVYHLPYGRLWSYLLDFNAPSRPGCPRAWSAPCAWRNGKKNSIRFPIRLTPAVLL
jgi:hypothetical protein